MSALTAIADRIFPREKLRQKLLDRVHKRRGPVRLPFKLEYRNIFVVPTVFGFGFGIMLVFMALGGLNFNNNLALLLVFIFGVVAQLTTVLAYRNLVGISIESIHAEPVFCGEPARFNIHLSNPEDRPRLTVLSGIRATQDCADIPENGRRHLTISQPTERRGWLSMEPFRLETRYPIGLFKAWTWFFPEINCLVYPEPAKKSLPLPRSGAGQSGQAQRGQGDQVHGLRPYRPGDPLKRVAWRTSARHDELYTREMETPRDDACEINWDSLQGMGLEERLAQMTAWVLIAEHRNIHYSLHLPGQIEPAGLGPEHRRQCLQLLALYGL